MKPSQKRYIRFCLATIISVYGLIFIGSVVRATGSGMGCPDWPKCFGQWIPPTSISELPADYKILFKVAGREIADFDAFKTWVEYFNRLLGVIIGLMVILNFWFSFSFRKKDKLVVFFSGLVVFLTVLQGWLGSKVVSSNLQEGMISLHMFLAIAILGILIFCFFRAKTQQDPGSLSKKIKWLSVLTLCLTCIQLFYGVQVRELVDSYNQVSTNGITKQTLESFGFPFFFHRSFSWLILGSCLLLSYQLWKEKVSAILFAITLTSILAEFGIGISLSFWNIPSFLQPFHLLFAVILFGGVLFLVFQSNRFFFCKKTDHA